MSGTGASRRGISGSTRKSAHKKRPDSKAVRAFSGFDLVEIGRRVDLGAVDPNLEVAVAAGGAAGGAGLGDGLPLIDLVSRADQQAGVVAVVGLLTVAVVDDDQVAVAALVAGKGDGAAVGRLDGGAVGDSNVDAGVVAVGAEDIAVAEAGGDPAVAGPDVVAVGKPGGRGTVPTATTFSVASRTVVELRMSRSRSWPLT